MARPRRISPAARARRALLIDVLAAVVLAAIVLSVAAGLGVVGFFGLPLLLAGLLWIGAERLHPRIRSRRPAPGDAVR
ncbi:MAG TPA: hypothetical protein VFP23_01565 [Solirubrobacterales bacterium]|nr:hypothetical protein [Solirubrobacterales bacterium]